MQKQALEGCVWWEIFAQAVRRRFNGAGRAWCWALFCNMVASPDKKGVGKRKRIPFCNVNRATGYWKESQTSGSFVEACGNQCVRKEGEKVFTLPRYRSGWGIFLILPTLRKEFRLENWSIWSVSLIKFRFNSEPLAATLVSLECEEGGWLFLFIKLFSTLMRIKPGDFVI